MLVSVVLGQRWVWVIAFFIAGAASPFATFASIIYFQILAAVLPLPLADLLGPHGFYFALLISENEVN
jgi:hypothetical protein